jgi:DNA-binding protein HU-beta
MNKSELIDAIATATDLTKVDAGKALNAITDSITGAMANDR